MHKSSSKLFLAALVLTALAAFTMASSVEAARGGGGSARIARSTSPSSASIASQRGGATRGR